MRVVQNAGDKEQSRYPLIIRKGRNTQSMMCGNKPDIKKFFTICNEAFKEQLEKNKLTRPTILTCTSA
jgi:hypothetical protein